MSSKDNSGKLSASAVSSRFLSSRRSSSSKSQSSPGGSYAVPKYIFSSPYKRREFVARERKRLKEVKLSTKQVLTQIVEESEEDTNPVFMIVVSGERKASLHRVIQEWGSHVLEYYVCKTERSGMWDIHRSLKEYLILTMHSSSKDLHDSTVGSFTIGVIWFRKEKTLKTVEDRLRTWLGGSSYAISSVGKVTPVVKAIGPWDLTPATNISLARRHACAALTLISTAMNASKKLYKKSILMKKTEEGLPQQAALPSSMDVKH